jgi:hypothetical protein
MRFMKAIRWAALLAFYAIYGAGTLIVGIVKLVRRLLITRRLLRDEMRCPACQSAVSTLGRWSCASCSSVYLGSATVCPNCRSHAAHFPCHCGASIPLEPWR